MSDLVPAATPAPSLLFPLTDPAGGTVLDRMRSFGEQPVVRRMLPWFLGVAALGGAALAWQTIAPSPQRTLYSQLDDSQRAGVVEALGKAGIAYRIDNQTGALTVAEGDYYRARMFAASDGALAVPDGGGEPLASLPMGASRTLEEQHLRANREHELMLTIAQIDGVESVRVHLAEGEKSVFVRENAPPTASVMVRMKKGCKLGEAQVEAIVNLVAASTPGLSPDAVRVIDQHGRLLTDKAARGDDARLEMQSRMEEKLRTQLAQLLTPMLGEGNFTSEIQVELDMDQVTTARENYDKTGVVRSETQQQSTTSGAAVAGGIPGVLSNTPPPAATASPGPPQGSVPTPATSPSPAPSNGEASTTRNYELGREVAVANSTPGKVKRLSVAVAISGAAMKNNKADIDQVRQLISAAVGLDPQRGDQVAVIARNFKPAEVQGLPFYESGWFAMILRNAAALLAVLLVLLLGVRPLIKALRSGKTSDEADAGTATATALALSHPIDPALLTRQIGHAQQLIAEKPETAVAALKQMLGAPEAGTAA